MCKFWGTLRTHQNNIMDNMTVFRHRIKNKWNWQENVRDTEIFYWHVMQIFKFMR